MFIKYAINGGQANTSVIHTNRILDDIAGIFDGSITALNQLDSEFCDVGNSTWIGSLNTSLYTDVERYQYDVNNSVVRFVKRHSDYAADKKWARSVAIAWDPATYGIRMRSGFPDSDAQGLSDSLTRYAPAGPYYNTYAMLNSVQYRFEGLYVNSIDAIYIYATDEVFMIQFRSDSASYAMYTHSLIDAYPTLLDTKAYELTENNGDGGERQRHSPQYWMSGFATSVGQATATSNTSFQDEWEPRYGLTGYLSLNGTYRYERVSNSTTNNYLFEQSPNTYRNLNGVIMKPSSFEAINSVADSDANPLTQMIPINMYPLSSASETDGVAHYHGLKGIYRIVDDYAYSGEIVTIGGTQYVVAMVTKVGAGTGASSDSVRNSCYLIPVL